MDKNAELLHSRVVDMVVKAAAFGTATLGDVLTENEMDDLIRAQCIDTGGVKHVILKTSKNETDIEMWSVEYDGKPMLMVTDEVTGSCAVETIEAFFESFFG